jgi:hypothetical protein
MMLIVIITVVAVATHDYSIDQWKSSCRGGNSAR